MKLTTWVQRHTVLFGRMTLALYALCFAALLYVIYPLVEGPVDNPPLIDKTRLVILAFLAAFYLVHRVGTLVLGTIEFRQSFRNGYLGELPSATHRVDTEAVLSALETLDARDEKWLPQLRDSVQEFLSLPQGTEKWAKRATLLSNLYTSADRGAIPFEIRRKLNNLRRAINLEIDRP
jgi:hypothetical protein